MSTELNLPLSTRPHTRYPKEWLLINGNSIKIAGGLIEQEAKGIVKACNSHADLLKACNRMVKILSHKSMRPMLNPAEAAELREAEIVVTKAK